MADRVHCAHILVKTMPEAEKILIRIKNGESFSELAKERSECPSGKKGGDLGTFGRGQMVREFDKVAFDLEKGQLSQSVKTQFGWHIIKRLE
ncbi:MAG: peptidylprolyl isomerase [Candidatus Thorarchaeota archaeon]|jgi:parvulin-like peptidyl-prolyl isomerase